MVSCFPCVVCIGVPFPFDEVLELSFTAKVTVINDGLDFIFFNIFDKVEVVSCSWSRVLWFRDKGSGGMRGIRHGWSRLWGAAAGMRQVTLF